MADGFAPIELAQIALGQGGFVIHGENARDYAGFSVAAAGDLNGDGFADLVIGARRADGAGNRKAEAGGAYVVFGRDAEFPTAIDLVAVARGEGGFVIHGENVRDYAGYSVASAGDVNGDGFDDLIIGAIVADGTGDLKDSAGAAYVVFGKAAGFGPAIDLGDVAQGEGGFVLQGANAFDRTGQSVASAGDINGDGFADLLVGATGIDNRYDQRSGGAYVVFGRGDGFAASIELASVARGVGGFILVGDSDRDAAGFSVASAGDLNGDGFDDLVVGALEADSDRTGDREGAVYVVYGKASRFGASIDLREVALGQGGFIIEGQDFGDRAGASVASAGDVNGDGFDDLIIGAPGANGSGATRNYGGGAYVVFGKATGFAPRIKLEAVAQGQGGFFLQAEDLGDYAGISVAAAGDVNGDGFGDLIIGARYGDGTGNAQLEAGDTYVVFGKPAAFAGTVSLRAVAQGDGGFVIRGEDAGDRSGISVAGAGDLNGDGFDDLVVGAWFADGAENAKLNAGAAYVIFGRASGTGTPTLGDDVLAGGDGPDTIDGLAGDDALAGSGGDDLLRGGLGRDTLRGGDGSDTLRGGGTGDVMEGGAGNDRLVVDGGRDQLAGGDGADRFVFRAAVEGRQVVLDFDGAAGDRIELHAFGGLDFIGDAAFSGVAGELRAARRGTGQRVEADIDGDAEADLVIDLRDAAPIAAEWLLL